MGREGKRKGKSGRGEGRGEGEGEEERGRRGEREGWVVGRGGREGDGGERGRWERRREEKRRERGGEEDRSRVEGKNIFERSRKSGGERGKGEGRGEGKGVGRGGKRKGGGLKGSVFIQAQHGQSLIIPQIQWGNLTALGSQGMEAHWDYSSPIKMVFCQETKRATETQFLYEGGKQQHNRGGCCTKFYAASLNNLVYDYQAIAWL